MLESRGRRVSAAVLTATEQKLAQRRTLLVLASATILGGLGVGASLSVGALLLAEVSGSDAISGLASAMFNAGAAVAGIPLAKLAAKRGRRVALVGGSFVAMVGAFVAIFGTVIDQWFVLALGIALLGVASTVQLLSRFAATDLAAPSNRARDLSLVVWSITVGAVVGPNLLAPGAAMGELLGLTPLAGVFVFPIIAQALAVCVNWFGLRPDPLLAARAIAAERGDESASAARQGTAQPDLKVGERTDTGTIVQPRASMRRAQVLTIFSIAMAQAIMVALMAMTPLHLMHHEGTPEIVGFTLSLHIAGMYALSPLFGYLAGRIGSLPTISIGWAVLVVAVVLAALSGSSHTLVQVALTLVGIGWGFVTVAGAALLTAITPSAERPIWQGRSDTFMSAAGAVAGVLSGIIFALGDFTYLAIASGGLLALGAIASLQISATKRRAIQRAETH